MGGAQSLSSISREEIEEYAALTFLSQRQIVCAVRLFRSLDPAAFDVSRQLRLPAAAVLQGIPALRTSPFSARLVRLFCSGADDALSLEDFLDMLSVFSSAAPESLKAHYAFQLLDTDEDGELGRRDLVQLVRALVGPAGQQKLSKAEEEAVVEHMLDEADISRTGAISPQEFQQVIARCHDFCETFSFDIV